jgi:hypothetical protein
MANAVTFGQKLERTVLVPGAQIYCLFIYRKLTKENRMRLE